MSHRFFAMFLLVAFSASMMFAQMTPAPMPTQPAQTTATCLPPSERLLVSEWNSGTVREICVSPSGGSTSQVVSYIRSVTQLIPLGGESFYAYSTSGKLTKQSPSPFGKMQQYWRLPGGGFVTPIQYGVDIRLYWEHERLSVYLNDGGSHVINPSQTRDWFDTACKQVVATFPTGDEYCHAPNQNQIHLARRGFAGPDMKQTVGVFNPGDMPVAMVVKGEVVYVLLGNTYINNAISIDDGKPPKPNMQEVRLGRLVALRVFPDGYLEIKTLLSGLNLDADIQRQTMALSGDKLYFVTGSYGGGDGVHRIVRYNIETGEKETVFTAKPDEFLGALAVAPLFPNLPMPTPPPPSSK